MGGVLHRAVQVLEVLRATDDQGLSIRHAAERAQLSKSAVQRILRELVDTELAVQDPITRRYRLGPRLLALGTAYYRQLNVRQVALTHMARLRDATGETIGLTVRTGEQIMHIEQIESPDQLRATFEIGRRLPLWSGAPSRLFLAEEPADQIQNILARRAPADVTPINPPNPDTELAEIQQARRTGYAAAFDETTKGVSTLSVPIRDSSDELVATLSLIAPSRRMGPDRASALAPQLIATAQSISAELGWTQRKET